MSASGSGSGNVSATKKANFSAQVSRRVRACDECRRHKIRCSLNGVDDESVPCNRCARMKLTCNVTKSLQTILEERNVDEEWRRSVEERFYSILHRLDALEGEPIDVGSKRKRSDRASANSLGMLAEVASDGGVGAAATSWNEASNEAASAPGHYLSRIAKTTTATTMATQQNDSDVSSNAPTNRLPSNDNEARRSRMNVIERGLITTEQAFTLVKTYLAYLDPHVYSIVGLAHAPSMQQRQWNVSACVQAALQSIQRSPLLLLAICTVAALHSSARQALPSPPSGLYTTLHDEFVRSSAQQSVVRDQSLDDIRALLVASWWLRDISWISTGSAVRIATERAMQEAYKRCSDMAAGKRACRAKASGGAPSVCSPGEAMLGMSAAASPIRTAEREAYEAARLYYLVYVADHQAAIPFSRPPMTRQHAAVRNVRAWLAGCRLSDGEDARLASQVELWVLAHDVVDDFGVDVQQALTTRQVTEEIPRFLALVDRWQERWRFSNSANSTDEVELQAEMMRLFITAHVFRSPRGVDPLTIVLNDEETAEWALDEVEQRISFAQKSLPNLGTAPVTDSLRYRFDLGHQSVKTARRLIKLATKDEGSKTQPGAMFGLPIYPFAMVLFACLFLNKLSRRQDQASTTQEKLQGCSVKSTVQQVDRVARYLQHRIVAFCSEEHISATVLPGLLALLDTERERARDSNLSVETSDDEEQETSVDDHQADHSSQRRTFDDLMVFQSDAAFGEDRTLLELSTTSPSFNFDLKSLDQLSGERYLSGVSNDALFWNFSEF